VKRVTKDREKGSWLKEKLKKIWEIKKQFIQDDSYHELSDRKQSSEQFFRDDNYYQRLLGIKRMPKAGTLDNAKAREWYLYYEAKIPEIIIKNSTLKEQATLAHQIRNWCRTTARELMADRDAATQLEQTNPNLTLEQVRQRQIKKGLSYDDLTWVGVISSSTRSRDSVNKQLGVDPHKNELEINPLWRPYLKTPSSRDEAFERRIIEKNVTKETPLSYYESLIEKERKKEQTMEKFDKNKFIPREQRAKKVIQIEI
jgi:hypothetical protein